MLVDERSAQVGSSASDQVERQPDLPVVERDLGEGLRGRRQIAGLAHEHLGELLLRPPIAPIHASQSNAGTAARSSSSVVRL